MSYRSILLVCLILLSACATKSQSLDSLDSTKLKDHSLVYGSIWTIHGNAGRFASVLYGESMADGMPVRITGDDDTAMPGPEGKGEIRMFSVLLPAGEYRFTKYGGWGVEDSAPIQEFEASHIYYTGMMVCIDVWSTCRWLSIDQLGRDLYYASEAAPELPWQQTRFAFTDLSSSQLDFRAREVMLHPHGEARHRVTDVIFPVQRAGFNRFALQSNGERIGGAHYRHPQHSLEAQVLVYPMNMMKDDVAEKALSPRLREVVLNREVELALASHFSDLAGDNVRDAEQYILHDDFYFLHEPDGIRTGKRLDAIGIEDEAGSRIRYIIFSVDGWLIRFRFTWKETQDNASDPETGDADENIETLLRQFIAVQDWPETAAGDET